jgi:hypothetical protein
MVPQLLLLMPIRKPYGHNGGESGARSCGLQLLPTSDGYQRFEDRNGKPDFYRNSAYDPLSCLFGGG